MIEEYMESYGLTKPDKFEFAKRNLIIGKNGSGKTRLLKAYRDACRKEDKDVIYIYFPTLSAKYEESFEEVNVESALYDIVTEGEDMSYDEFVKSFQYTGVSLVESYIRELNARSIRKKEKADQQITRIQDNIKEFLGMELVISQKGQGADLKFSDERKKELKLALTEMSPGEINLFYMSLFLAITSEKRKYILIMDEPEMHVHPSVLIKFYRKLKKLSCMEEIWIATHSPLLLQEFQFEEIVLMVNGTIQQRNSHLYENVMSEMLGEGQKTISEMFRSLDEWNFCNFIAECFENPTVVSKANKSDEQAVRFMEYCISLKQNDLRILDWGAGSGRLGKCMRLIEENAPHKLKYTYEIYEPNIVDSERDEEFVTYKEIAKIRKKYNCVVLMNVLHEIGINEWVILFRQIKDCLSPDGMLIFAEAKVLSVGEQPHCENGYIVLGEKQIRILFGKEGYNSQMAVLHAELEKKEKSEFIMIPANELDNICQDNIEAALRNLETETFNALYSMNEERIQCVRNNVKPSFTYRKYAFEAQQYINVKMAIEKYFPKVTVQVRVEREPVQSVEGDSHAKRSQRNPHSLR